METDREDGTGFVLPFAVDVNENRAEGCKTHTLQPQRGHRNSVLGSGPKSALHPGGNRVTSEETEINGFPEPGGVTEPSPGARGGEYELDTSGHIRTPAGETGCFGPDLTGNRNLGRSAARWRRPGPVNSANGEDVDLWGFRSGPSVNVGTAGIWGTNGTSGETSGAGGAHSSCFISVETANVGEPLTASGHTNAPDTDVCERRASTLVPNRAAPAEPSGAGGTGAGTANAGEINGNLTASATRNASNGDEEDVWEFDGSPPALGEAVTSGEPSGHLATSGETTGTSWTLASVETSGTRRSSTAPEETVNIRGTNAASTTSGACANITASEEATNIWRSNMHLILPGETAAIGGTESGESDGTKSTQEEIVSVGGTSARVSTSGGTSAGMRTNCTGIIREETPGTCEANSSSEVADDRVDIGGAGAGVSSCGEAAGMKEGGGVSPRDRVAGNPRVCVRKCPRSSSTELAAKIPNGDVNCSEFQAEKTVLEKGVRVGNCGYLVINRRSISGTSSVPVYSIRDPRNTTELQREVRRSMSDLGPGSVSELSEGASERGAEDGVGGVGAARPRTLRTDPGLAMSLSCDSTPLDDAAGGYFVDDGDLDVVLSDLELGRRRSAPDKLQQDERVDPEPPDEPTAGRRHGLADFLTR